MVGKLIPQIQICHGIIKLRVHYIQYPICDSLCPDCGLVNTKNLSEHINNLFIDNTGHPPPGDPDREHGFLYRILITQEFAANAATRGYGLH